MSQRMLVEVLSRSNHTNTILKSVFNDVTRMSTAFVGLFTSISSFMISNGMFLISVLIIIIIVALISIGIVNLSQTILLNMMTLGSKTGIISTYCTKHVSGNL